MKKNNSKFDEEEKSMRSSKYSDSKMDLESKDNDDDGSGSDKNGSDDESVDMAIKQEDLIVSKRNDLDIFLRNLTVFIYIFLVSTRVKLTSLVEEKRQRPLYRL